MTEGRYGYCSIYVKAPDAPAVTRLLENALGTSSEDGNIRVAGVEMDARTNPDVDLAGEATDFVRWPVLIEADADDPHAREPMVSVISQVLTAFWEAGHPAVAACDFEPELPWSGGIRRLADASPERPAPPA